MFFESNYPIIFNADFLPCLQAFYRLNSLRRQNTPRVDHGPDRTIADLRIVFQRKGKERVFDCCLCLTIIAQASLKAQGRRKEKL